jgi:glyoxylase-like metal-dependent hydrolase (beta-lactamase superfamily II)
MRIAKFLRMYLTLLIPVLNISAHPAPEIPFKTHRLSDRVLFIKTGISSVMSNVTAIATAEGIVVIDAHYKPQLGKRIRDIVEKTFSRKDFSYLIYSHAGVDHMGGSMAFTDAVIVGHDNCIGRIDSLHKTLESVDIREVMAPRLKLIRDQMEKEQESASDQIMLEESLHYWTELTELTAGEFKYVKPSITFSDRLSIHSGDLSIELQYCTPGYSDSDIFIHVPGEKLLIVGDIFTKDRIPLLNEKSDIERWEALFRPFVDQEIDIQNIVSCHGQPMTLPEMKAQLDYLRDLWEGVCDAFSEGLTLEETKERFVFNKRFPQLHRLSTRWADTAFDLHERNIAEIWKAMENSATDFPLAGRCGSRTHPLPKN